LNGPQEEVARFPAGHPHGVTIVAFVVNTTTAITLGIEIPPSVILSADEVLK
jgi:hypothetical protein